VWKEYRGALGGKTSKTQVLPRFCKIERGSGGTPPHYRGLFWLGLARPTSGAPGIHTYLHKPGFTWATKKVLSAACNSKTLGTLQGGSNSYVAHFRCVTTLSRKPRGHILNTRFENKPDTRSIMLYFTTFCRQHTDAEAARRCCSSTLRFYSDTVQRVVFNNHSVE
jgi:hypothetical protein